MGIYIVSPVANQGFDCPALILIRLVYSVSEMPIPASGMVLINAHCPKREKVKQRRTDDRPLHHRRTTGSKHNTAFGTFYIDGMRPLLNWLPPGATYGPSICPLTVELGYMRLSRKFSSKGTSNVDSQIYFCSRGIADLQGLWALVQSA